MIKAVAAATLLAVLLVGCSPDPEPEPLPPAPSASPTPVALAVPPEATPETAEGAAAFARYYFEVVNRGLETGDAAQVRAISDPGCGGCTNLIGAIEEDPPAGERIEGGLFEVVSAEAPPVEEGDVIVELQYIVSEVRVYDSAGSVARSTPASGPTQGQIRLIRRGSGWVVQGFRGVE